MKKSGKLASILCAGLMLSACGQNAEPQSSSSSTPPSSIAVSSDSATSSGNVADKVVAQIEALSPITQKYVTPVMGVGETWKYAWAEASEIAADDLVEICSFNNYLDLPRDAELVYKPGFEKASADQVEAAIQKHFDVSGDHLKTSKYYDAKTDTYLLVGGFGGGCAPVAMEMQQNGNRIVLEIGILCLISESEVDEDSPAGLRSPDRIILPSRILVPAGKLTVEENGEDVQYISYQTNEGFNW